MTHHGTTTAYVEVLPTTVNEPASSKSLGNKPTSLDGYTPRNQKLLTYPYCYIGFTPANGNHKIFKYEDFSSTSCSFSVMSEISPSPQVAFVPKNYKITSGENYGEVVYITGYPTISYKTDVYNAWLAQNSEIISLNMAQEQLNYEVQANKSGAGLLGQMISMATGNVGALGNFMTGAIDLASQDKKHELNIQMQMAQIEKQKLIPDQASMGSTGSTLMGYNRFKYISAKYTIRSEFAQRIDKYFDMYGYLTNDRKIPNLNNRPNWNYVKTIGANIVGDIPQIDLQAIKDIFDNGVTLWHNSQTFLDYSQNNRTT